MELLARGWRRYEDLLKDNLKAYQVNIETREAKATERGESKRRPYIPRNTELHTSTEAREMDPISATNRQLQMHLYSTAVCYLNIPTV